MSTGPAAPEMMQGGKRQLKRGRKEMGRRTRVAGAAVGFTHSPGAFSWAPWSRGSWPCILSWTRRSRWHCVGRRWFGPSSSGRTSLRLLRHPSRSAAGGDWDPQAPEDPHPPYPHRLLLRLPAWGGAQGRALPPSPERTGSCHPRGQARYRALPCPRLSSAHPLPGQLKPGRAKGTGSCRKMAAPGSSSELSGLPRVTWLGHRPSFSVSRPFSLLFPLRRRPSLARRGKSGAAPARYVMEPARRAQQEAPPQGQCAARRVTWCSLLTGRPRLGSLGSRRGRGEAGRGTYGFSLLPPQGCPSVCGWNQRLPTEEVQLPSQLPLSKGVSELLGLS